MSGSPQIVQTTAQGCEVRLRFADGVEHAIEVAAEESVLGAALRSGVRLAHQCMSGSCGTCVGRVLQGTLEMHAASGHCLLPSELLKGQRLLCVSKPMTDSQVELDYPSSVLEFGATTRIATRVVTCEWVAASVVRLALELPDETDFSFKPGQYVRVRVPGTDEWRSYSMATTPMELPVLELLVRILPDGAMSSYLRDRCAIGDTVEIDGPHGAFFLRDSRATHVMIAGGTGLAPMMAMLDELRRSAGKRPKVLLSFGCASPESLFYLDELEARADWMPNLNVRVCVDRGGTGYTGAIGNPVQLIAPADVADPGTIAYVCGPPLMIAAAREYLQSLGVRGENILAEQFASSSGSAAVAADTSLGSDLTLEV